MLRYRLDSASLARMEAPDTGAAEVVGRVCCPPSSEAQTLLSLVSDLSQLGEHRGILARAGEREELGGPRTRRG